MLSAINSKPFAKSKQEDLLRARSHALGSLGKAKQALSRALNTTVVTPSTGMALMLCLLPRLLAQANPAAELLTMRSLLHGAVGHPCRCTAVLGMPS